MTDRLSADDMRYLLREIERFEREKAALGESYARPIRSSAQRPNKRRRIGLYDERRMIADERREIEARFARAKAAAIEADTGMMRDYLSGDLCSGYVIQRIKVKRNATLRRRIIERMLAKLCEEIGIVGSHDLTFHVYPEGTIYMHIGHCRSGDDPAPIGHYVGAPRMPDRDGLSQIDRWTNL